MPELLIDTDELIAYTNRRGVMAVMYNESLLLPSGKWANMAPIWQESDDEVAAADLTDAQITALNGLAQQENEILARAETKAAEKAAAEEAQRRDELVLRAVIALVETRNPTHVAATYPEGTALIKADPARAEALYKKWQREEDAMYALRKLEREMQKAFGR